MNNIAENYDNVKMPENIDFRIREALIKADKERKRTKNIFKFLKCSAAAAALIIIYGISVNVSPVFASTTKNVPILAQLTQVLQIYPDRNIQNAVNNGFAQEINKSKVSNGVKLTINSVIADDRKAIISYTIKTEEKKLNNLLIEDLKVMDKDNNLLLDSEKSHGRNGENNFYTISMWNFKPKFTYDGLVMTNDALNKDFSKTGEIKGLIEISNGNESISMPDILNLDFSRIVEAYPEPGNDLNEHPNDYNYNSFKAKYNREPEIIDGDWKFSIQLDKNLKSASSIDYTNVKFTALNINFNMDLKMYPTTLEAKITNDNKEDLVTIGHSYIEDDKGNKYDAIRGYGSSNPDIGSHITYESPYFSNSNHLYFVIDEIDIGDPDSHPDFKHKIEPIRIKLK